MSKINNIQALRAYAATAVVFFHADNGLFGLPAFGAFGVPVFFMISGFIMAMICAEKSDAFLRRRLLRILPLYWGATLAVFLAASCLPAMLQSTRPSVMALFKSLMFIPFEKAPGVVQPLLFLGWTLNYEMFFYVALGIGLLIAPRHAAALGSAIVIGVMLACAPFRDHSVVARFYAAPITLEFIAGIVLYKIWKRVPDWPPVLWGALVAVAAVGLVVLEVSLVGSLGKVVLACAAFVLVFGCVMLSRAGYDTNCRTLVLAGDASYVLYLLHPYVEQPAVRLLAGMGLYNLWTALLIVCLAVAASIVAYLWIERPVTRALSRRFIGHRKVRGALCDRSLEPLGQLASTEP